MATAQLSLDEYLRTVYEPDCDYVEGELEERNLGEQEHSAVQAFLIKWLALHEQQWKLEAYPEIRLRIAPRRVRVAGVANIWAIDPMRRKAFHCSRGGWQPVDKLVIPNSPIEIPLDPLWKKLVELHS